MTSVWQRRYAIYRTGLRILLKDSTYLVCQSGIGTTLLRGAARPDPGVIATAHHPEGPTHGSDTEFIGMVSHKLVGRSALLEKSPAPF
jgi:hypothetical protein